jgi:type IV fimbrial biogenesis protein FimT
MTMKRQRAFTLVELLIVVALTAVVLSLAAPSLRDFILVQRLKSISSSLVTDMQYARSEAVSRGKNVWVYFKLPSNTQPMSCYTIYTDSNSAVVSQRLRCNCTLAPGSRCQSTATELKTVQIPTDLAVRLGIDTGVQATDFAFDPVTGSVFIPTLDIPVPVPTAFVVDVALNSARTLRTRVALSGRPSVCLPTGSTVSGGYNAC